MDELTRRALIRLRDDPSSLSRNRNFESYGDPRLARARRVARFLRSLERDLLAGEGLGPVAIEPLREGRGLRIRIRFPSLRGSRTSYLSAEEFDVLLRNPELRRILQQREIA